MNSSLATIPNRNVNEFVGTYLKKANNQTGVFWIGLHWSHSILRWISGYPAVVDVLWNNSIVDFNFNCVVASVDGRWNPRLCTEPHPFLCSSEMKDFGELDHFLPTSRYECPPKFHLVGRRCLRFFVDEMTSRVEAESVCTRFGAYLVTIRSFRENDLLVAMLADYPSTFWLGLSYKDNGHRWANPSEAEITFTNWMENEPRGDISNNCAVIHTDLYFLGKWSEVSCSSTAHFVCEADPKIVPSHIDSHLHGDLFVPGRCSSGFYEYRSACYIVIDPPHNLVRTSDMRADSVTAACQDTVLVKNCSATNVGTVLCPVVASPHDQFDAAFLRSLVDKFQYSNAAWVGLKADRNHVYSDMPIFWESTSLLNHSIADSLNNSTVCFSLHVDKTLLSNDACESHLPVLCGYQLDPRSLLSWPQSLDVKPEVLKCPSGGWELFGTNCYRLEGVSNANRSWHDAELTCIQHGGHLVSIASPAEDDFVYSLLPTAQSLKPWIGLQVFLDAGEDGDTVMKWTDSSPVNYYSPLYVDRHSEEGVDCFQLAVVQGKKLWTRANGCKESAPFVCKKLASSISSDWNVNASDHCLPRSHPEFCFSINHTAVKFFEAVSACQAVGKHVATILDDSQQDFVLRALQQLSSPEVERHTPRRYWIGLLRSRGTLHWASGYPAVPNVYWKTGFDDFNGVCVYVDVDLGGMLNWGTANCEEVYPFLCSNVPPLPTVSPPLVNSSFVHLNPSCPLDFLYVSGKCYKVEGDRRINFTFTEAVSKCSHSGGHLATISSMYEQDIVSVLLAERTLPFWIGLNATASGRAWVRGAPITYTNWMGGYPKWFNPRNPLCTYVGNQPAHAGQWAEAACDERMGFICEAKPTEARMLRVFTPRLFSQDDCAPGFLHHRGACYMLLDASFSPLSGRSASQLYDGVSAACAATAPVPLDCEKARGLAGCPVTMTPHSPTEAAFMRLLISGGEGGGYANEVWTGLKIFSNNSLDSAQTEDRVALGSFDIDFSHLDNASGLGYTCFSLHKDHTFLRARHCLLHMPAICGYYLDTHPLHPELTTVDDFACPVGTERVGRSCFYRVDAAIKMNWHGAEEYCASTAHDLMLTSASKSFVGHLPAVHDPFTLRFLSQLSGNESVWLGLTSTQEPQSGTNGSWFDSQLHWSDGSPVDYLAFAPAAKSTYKWESLVDNLKTCVALDPQSGLWKKIVCFKLLTFICQFPIGAFPKINPVSGNKYLPAVTQCPSNFIIKTENACYTVVKTRLSAKNALAFCQGLHPHASLASLHSEKEGNDLLAQMAGQHLEEAYWFGLSQSDLQYVWTDSSVVDYLPKTNITVEPSHFWHFQDCFTFIPIRNGSNAPLTAERYETDCSAERPFICQVYRGIRGPPSMEPAHPARFDLPPLRCPQGYRQHEDRCFRFFPTLRSFDDAESVCRKVVEGTGFIGFLARISNSRDQDFVAGLFAAEAPRQPSMAWIGLRQGEKRWTDGTEVTFSRESLDFPGPVPGDEENMCTFLLYSSNVHFYGLWSRSACSISDQVYFICQAVPTSLTVASTTEPDAMESTTLTCGLGYTLGFFNRTALALAESLPPPHCLQLVSPNPMTWQDAKSLCKEQSASLPSIDTLADLSFFRVWLQTPRSLGGAGLPANTSVWLDLRVPACPNCYSNWRWHAGELDESPVRLMDWFNAPLDPSGCYLFHVASPALNPTVASHLRSIRPAISCTNVSLPVVCQRSLRLPSNDSRLAVDHCVRNPTPELSSVTAFHTNHSVARSGRPCIRWDLVQHDFNRSDAVLPRYWRIFTAMIAYSEHASPFWEGHCAHLPVQDATGKTMYRYACYTSTDPDSGLEDCDLDDCVTSLIPLGWIIFIALACLALGVAITLCLVRAQNQQRFYIPRGRWFSPIKMTSSSSVFSGAAAIRQHQFQQQGVLYNNGDGDPTASSVRMFDADVSPSPLHSIVPSLTFKHNVYRPLHDQDPLLLDEPDNADEFTGPV